MYRFLALKPNGNYSYVSICWVVPGTFFFFPMREIRSREHSPRNNLFIGINCSLTVA